MNTILGMSSLAFWLSMAGLWLNGVAIGVLVFCLLDRRFNV